MYNFKILGRHFGDYFWVLLRHVSERWEGGTLVVASPEISDKQTNVTYDFTWLSINILERFGYELYIEKHSFNRG